VTEAGGRALCSQSLRVVHYLPEKFYPTKRERNIEITSEHNEESQGFLQLSLICLVCKVFLGALTKLSNPTVETNSIVEFHRRH
jgi:hypothetical protein